MDIRKLILKKIAKNKEIKVSNIVKLTKFSRAYINRFFKALRDEKKIVLIGKANQVKYVIAAKKAEDRIKKKILNIHRILINKNLFEDTILEEIKKNSGIFLNLPDNIFHILNYTFTEMLNNAIEHSYSKKIIITIKRSKEGINFKIADKGIGIFNNIMKKYNLKNELEAIQDLLKGKQTTLPKEHSGEGIFFTSKVADKLTIKSFSKKLIFNNQINDIFIKNIKKTKGTKVEFEIFKNSKKQLNAVFKEYAGEMFEFSKTKIIVKLYKMDNIYISRSQARRIMINLDKFKTIILDFKDVETVGQAFADEIFRVWQKTHSNIKIIYQNASENIQFMINRALFEN